MWVGGVNEGGEVCSEKDMGVGRTEREGGREGVIWVSALLIMVCLSER